jgi:hypothetical protein
MKSGYSFYFLLVIVFVGCGKYEEGPGLSFRSKKARLTGDWKIVYVSLNGDDITSGVQNNLGTEYVLSIRKDGTFHEEGKNVVDNGTWELGHEKAYLMLLSDIPGSEEEHYEILKLKNKELWVRHSHDIHVTEVHYLQE